MAGLAWAPLWYGSNDLIAWGINAVVFPGLAAFYELSLLIRGKPHPMGIRHLAAPAALFVLVVGWIVFQALTWNNPRLVAPIWGMAAEALARPLAASISVNRDLTLLALVRLITVASVFWLSLQLCRDRGRAKRLIAALAAIGCAYSVYGLVALALASGRLPWFEHASSVTSPPLSSTFINQNSFATYAGMGVVAVAGIFLQYYRRAVAGVAGNWRLQIVSLIETIGQHGVVALIGGIVTLVALLLTGSRGGVIATSLALLPLGLMSRRHGDAGPAALWVSIFGFLVVAVGLLVFGDAVLDRLTDQGIADTNRAAVYLLTIRSILDAPFLGQGYGTFVDVFPMYRDRSISVQGVWGQAHDTYLEVFQGLGLGFGSMLVAVVVVLAWRCIRASIQRQQDDMVPRVAASATILVGIHSLVDFSLQIQAVALTVGALLGAGVAQSESSRRILSD